MRCFLAITVPDAMIGPLLRLQSELRIGRAMRPETFHITLTFLGEITDRQLDALLEEVASLRLVSPEVGLSGVGHFGHERPRQVWAGVAGSEALERLASALTGAARRAGIAVEKRRFVPHVTLVRLPGRIEDAARVTEFEARHTLFRTEPLPVFAVTLFQSHLHPEGARHEDLAQIPLEARQPR